MNIVSSKNLTGDLVNLKAPHKLHIKDSKEVVKSNNPAGSFANALNTALNEVNSLELKSTDLTNQMVVDPESVNIHDVQIAAEQAEMSVLLTKGIVDKVIKAYKEITNLR